METIEAERLTIGLHNLTKRPHVGSVDAYREEVECLALFASVHSPRCHTPLVGRTAICDQEHPRAEIADTRLLVVLLARLQHIEATQMASPIGVAPLACSSGGSNPSAVWNSACT